MKEYIAETGGRYTYTDDILNLQELALSMTAVFEGCSDFIVSGCGVNGSEIAPGYVWINGKIRYFAGCRDAVFPYYLYERNVVDATVYANEVNKKGRCSYLCLGASRVPQEVDEVTGSVPRSIEVTPEYAPRLIDKFFGRYALLVDSPFASQVVKRDVRVTGGLMVDKGIGSLEAVTVGHPENGRCLKGYVREDGDPAIGIFQGDVRVSELIFGKNGSFGFYKGDKHLMNIDERFLDAPMAYFGKMGTGEIVMSGDYLINDGDLGDDGTLDIHPYKGDLRYYRNFRVFDGRTAAKGVPLFEVTGKKGTVSAKGAFEVVNSGKGMVLSNGEYVKGNAGLTNLISWTDRKGEVLATVGYGEDGTYDFSLVNTLGALRLAARDRVNIEGDLYVKGVNVSSLYIGQTAFAEALKGKVDVVPGKGLSSEDFTGAHKRKLEGIATGAIVSGGLGYVTAQDVAEHLEGRMSKGANLSDVVSKEAARGNLGVYSSVESDRRFLRVSEGLRELVSLSADEVNGLDADEAAELKAQKQAKVRETLDAEKRGTGELKLSKASNLGDLPDKEVARRNISVYSAAQVDELLRGKLSVDGAYIGAVFTQDHKQKLEGIKTGNFAGVNGDGVSVSQVEGYVLTSGVVRELAKKANLLLDGYSASQKQVIAGNIGVYTTGEANERFASVSGLMQDYITYQVRLGKTTSQAQQVLRDKLDVLSKAEVTAGYVRKDGLLTDLALKDAEAKKQVCRRLGAAYAEEYQVKLVDTGWIRMGNSGSVTDTSQLYVRQIGSVVCIQGIVNTGKRNGSNWGGVVAVIPNQISPPKYGLRVSYADYNDGHTHNRGASFVIKGGDRNVLLYESGFKDKLTEIHFSYMT